MAFALLDHTEEKATIDEILTGTFREKDRQINFAIEELKKIKADIKENAECKVTDKSVRYVKLTDVLTILDKSISELKGE